MGALIAIYILVPLTSAEPASPYAPAIVAGFAGLGLYGFAWFTRYSYRRDKKRSRYSDPW